MNAFDARSIESRYGFLDDCPAHLLDAIVTLPIGDLGERVAGIRSWRESLLDGRFPPPGGWPDSAVGDPVRQALAKLDIARFCKGQVDLVDNLLKDVLASFARQAAGVTSEIAEALRELEALERKRISDEV